LKRGTGQNRFSRSGFVQVIPLGRDRASGEASGKNFWANEISFRRGARQGARGQGAAREVLTSTGQGVASGGVCRRFFARGGGASGRYSEGEAVARHVVPCHGVRLAVCPLPGVVCPGEAGRQRGASPVSFPVGFRARSIRARRAGCPGRFRFRVMA
jgi:hypothetical protein